MFVVAGLGNPGPRYAGNRHNIGFMVVDRLARRWGAPSFRSKHDGELSKAAHGGDAVVLLKPQTFMNRSGDSVQPTLRFFKVDLSRLLVIHDELDLPYGTLRVKNGGGAAGHNGLRSITERCGGNGYLRLRLGVGRPEGRSTESHVLSDFSPEESKLLESALEMACDAVETVLRLGPAEAMNRLNRRVDKGAG